MNTQWWERVSLHCKLSRQLNIHGWSTIIVWGQLLLLYLCLLSFFFFVPEQREVPPIIARDCQWTFIVTYICCEVQMKQMFCKRTKMISFFPVTPFICLQL